MTQISGASPAPISPDQVNELNASQTNSTANQTLSNANSLYDSVSGTASSVKDSIGTFFSDFGGNVVALKDSTLNALSLQSLQKTGQETFDGIGETFLSLKDGFVTSTPVSTAGGWISTCTKGIKDATNTTAKFTHTNWLPVSVAALSTLTAVSSAKAAVSNFQAGNFKKAAVQVLVGTVTGSLAGSLMYQTGLIQSSFSKLPSFS